MKASGNVKYHVMALIVALIWGTTLTSTKVLLNHGLSPAEIMIYRFVLAYVSLWIIHPKQPTGLSLRGELKFMLLGILGGSLYFLTENTALKLTLASNVALIVVTAPILTMFLSRLMLKTEPIGRYVWIGSFIALSGVALVVYNGNIILELNPLGDILSIAAALSWAFYSVLLKRINNNYNVLFYTRKIFFYGIVTLIPWFFIPGNDINTSLLCDGEVILNLLFLGIVASSGCYVIWNMVISRLGVVKTSNYIYLVPMVSLIFSVIFLNEPLTIHAITGSVLILAGVYIAAKIVKKNHIFV